MSWTTVCTLDDILPNAGAAALVGDTQLAVFRVDDRIFALDNHCPFSRANVLARGIVGSVGDTLVVASPLYKQHFSLEAGHCLEDDSISVRRFPARNENGLVQVQL
ncbi:MULTISPECIES: nitrite reductase small subunit NirD [Spongiibacter]|jgi:nitrite reductase (NADH) small subunit|uniref:nitrite reductase small subunit NirD n=1 Tax=Spongiibacter TaxID=630749 RepID=UPI000C0B05C7|nr:MULTISPECIES: nitrite reductase small subunit NirD [Spongiibacter]MAK44869.1 nitrite reductase (NAD(P)H) small subunit [Spongiibacter sp.]MBM7423673.1 nitrite reductase (NADH) small subunit [Spongiibacter marinus]MEE2652022.1 nitrite reductase small subunit NirD [Pseudomonadota bacterium]|tara:strand:- start:3092 stop:3409 length:318 start_codon:yes stop_codon:yes gene_type:complete